MLYLLPNLLADLPHHELFLPPSVDRAVARLDGLIAESERAARRFLGRFETKRPASEIPVALFNRHTPDRDLDFLLEPLQKGETWGCIADAGLPCIADPGSKLVWRARELGLRIQAFTGPSSLFLSLMLSGLPAQKFQFHGYLSSDPARRRGELLSLEGESRKKGLTQLFIETPYRNMALLQQMVECLDDETKLAAAWDLTQPSQGVVSQKVAFWKKSPLPNLKKKPAIFQIFSG